MTKQMAVSTQRALFVANNRRFLPICCEPTTGHHFAGNIETRLPPDTGLLTEWPENGPELIWESAGAGRGYSSLAIANGRIYTLGDASSITEDDDEYLFCF